MNNGLELKGYNYIRSKFLEKHRNKSIFIKLLKYSRFVIENYIGNNEFIDSINSPNNKSKQLKFKENGKPYFDNYLIKGEDKFNEVLNKRKKYGYNAIVYLLRCRIKPYENKIYFGWTKLNSNDRFKIHLKDAISPHGRDSSYPNIVELHKAIRRALEVEKIDYRESFYTLKENMGKTFYWKYFEYLINLVEKHFDKEIIEIHRDVRTAKEREKWYTLNFINEDQTIGTIKPSGLNEVAGGSGGGRYIKLPLINIAALISLGLNERLITKLINRLYTKVARSTIASRIREIWGSFSEARYEFLKPVVEALLKDKSDFFFVKDICFALNMDHRSLTNHLRDWYKGRGFSILRLMIKRGELEWSDLDAYIEDERPELHGTSLEQWENWLIEGISGSNIGRILGGLSKSTVENFYKQIPEFGPIRETKKALRREKALELFKKGWDPKDIMIDVFKMKVYSINDVIKFYNYLFERKMNKKQLFKFAESFFID